MCPYPWIVGVSVRMANAAERDAVLDIQRQIRKVATTLYVMGVQALGRTALNAGVAVTRPNRTTPLGLIFRPCVRPADNDQSSTPRLFVQ